MSRLLVTSCDLLKEKNGEAHHTDQYDTVSSRLVVRRGKSFMLRLTFNRSTNFPSDQIRFELCTGGRPMTNHKTKIYLNSVYPKAGDRDVVGVRHSSFNTGKVMDLEVFTPSDMIVSQWILLMYSSVKGRRYISRSVVSDNIVVLFNAWNKDDDVYMENEKWRNEYVLNDEGFQYTGSARRIGSMPWYFGQFEREVLDVSLRLIKMDRLFYRERGNPTAVARHMSSTVNSSDNWGVLSGNWGKEEEDYEGGTKPWEWVGSYAILKEYYKTDEPVMYGQCWVFAGVLCTVLRSLGIPARCVTNFESAHDTENNLLIDYLYDEKYKSIYHEDSVWNFHVWNDAWMARSDLPKGFGGWQALDATPQEESRGRMRCGPMSLNAIKQGMVNMDYDGPFVYCEVNGTKRHWKRVSKNPDKFVELNSETAAIGKYISTKEVGSDRREDVTQSYKYKEGTHEERMSFKNARKHVKWVRSERKELPPVIKFEADIPDVVPIGQDIVGTFKFTNISKSPQEVYIGLVAKVMQYNGSVIANMLDMEGTQKVAVGGYKELKATVPANHYLKKIKNNEAIKFFALASVKGPGADPIQTFAYHDSVELEKPTLQMKAAGSKFKFGDNVSLTLSFTNPLSSNLSAGKIRVEGSGITDVLEIPVPAVKAKSTFTKTIKVKPRRTGLKKVIAGYASPSLSGLVGSASFAVYLK